MEGKFLFYSILELLLSPCFRLLVIVVTKSISFESLKMAADFSA